jgi:hypothetical protein
MIPTAFLPVRRDTAAGRVPLVRPCRPNLFFRNRKGELHG